MPNAPDDKDREGIEEDLNEYIGMDARDLAIRRLDHLARIGLMRNPILIKTMAVKPPMGAGADVRLVRIGEEDDQD